MPPGTAEDGLGRRRTDPRPEAWRALMGTLANAGRTSRQTALINEAEPMRRAAPLGSLLLAAALVVPAPGPLALLHGSGPVAGPAVATATGLGTPSEAYLESVEHARDHLSLAAPRPVTVALRARTSERFVIDGRRAGASPVPAPATASGGARRPAQEATSPSPTLLGAPTPSSGQGGSPGMAGTPGAGGSPAPSTGGPGREIYGFLPYWELGDPTMTLDYSVLSTIAYFGLTATASGTLQQAGSDGTPEAGWTGWQSGNLTSIVDAAHAQGTRVALTVERFAWDTSGTAATVSLLSSPAAQATLIGQTVGQVLSRGVDGVNLDFEPVPAGQSANFVAFVRALRAALDVARPGLELVVDVTSDLGNYDVPSLTAPGAADALFVMGYDYRGAGAASAGSIDPLVSQTYYTDLTRALGRYLALTTPGHLLLGLPYYGRAWSTASNTPNALTLPQNAQNGYSVSAPYDVAAGLAEANGRQWDPTESSAWTAYQKQNCDTCPSVWRELYYDDAQSLAARYQLVLADNLRGAGIWALGYDGTRPELTALLHQVFGTAAPLPPTGALTVTTGAPPGNPPNAFSPNGDGVADTASLSWWVSEPMTGTLAVRSGTKTVWSTPVTASSGSVAWNGTGANGTPVADGTYTVALSVQDTHGNTVTQSASVIVNRVLGFLAASPNRFHPQDAHGHARTTTISYRVTSAASTTLRILDSSGAVVKTAWYARRTPAGRYAWIWDGRDAAGSMVPQGDYTIQVVASGTAGRAFLVRPLTVAAYMVRTAVTSGPAGATLVVNAWASEPMRGAPSITLSVAGQRLAGLVTVAGTGHYMATFSGPDLVGPGTVTISGVDAGGRGNRYSVAVSFPGSLPPPVAPGVPPTPSAPIGPTPSAAPTPPPSPSPSPSPSAGASTGGYPFTITAMCPSIRLRTGPDTTAPVAITLDTGAVATAGAAVTGSTYTSACFQLGTYQSWYLVTAVNGQPLASPLYAATAFWSRP
ncbi:MAG: glycosyl hydrolase family 18 protein [Candidatus Limnocylindrales bacterium]